MRSIRAALLLSGLAACAAPALVEGSPPTRRLVAEWEPALGVLVAWRPVLPAALLRALAEDAALFVMVADGAGRREAEGWFRAWGIDAARVTFLELPQTLDAGWPRDWGPHAAFMDDGTQVMVDASYTMSTPVSAAPCDAELHSLASGTWHADGLPWDFHEEDPAPSRIARLLGRDALVLDYALTGGNVLTDGQGGALSTCILVSENRALGLDEDTFLAAADRDLGLDRYTVVPNFEPFGMHHIDCLVKLLDERRMLVARPPADHELSEPYERMVTEHLARLRTAHGDPFEVLRIDTARFEGEELAAYTNSLVLEDAVYVPLYGIPQDARALEQWRAALPGHRIRGFEYRLADEPLLSAAGQRAYDGPGGWRADDALHCRTRAIWDPEMLAVQVEELRREGGTVHVGARIVPHSGARLVARTLAVHWRPAAGPWRRVPLVRGAGGLFRARLEAPGPVELYVTAADTTGRAESAPRYAPRNRYRLGAGAGDQPRAAPPPLR